MSIGRKLVAEDLHFLEPVVEVIDSPKDGGLVCLLAHTLLMNVFEIYQIYVSANENENANVYFGTPGKARSVRNRYGSGFRRGRGHCCR